MTSKRINEIDSRILLIEVLDWKKKYIKNQLELYPDISKVELIKKIKRDKYVKFKKQVDNLILDAL